ncbi:HD domain-containing protein [Streptococcus loxodontisalivarius]|uniref:HD superfamily phosphohydrolase n=1 Tax=Streptococcus loxodontisalivarius TaxID=1349415 RepID=A0ABS2PSS9_9STRE|nr:HD domain-containing protein [Streptococcus loxodontisalivarius]MBM7642559.1 HD superfamily phosphohydrolase [Streptococcus loxodontisalivarius]
MEAKYFRDPIHGYIQVDHDIIYDLINSREFQRLRRIKQLGTSNCVFPGAEHTRFSHSLGAYHIARSIIERFEKSYADIWDSKNSLLTMVSALLHDIGHGAYSHTFELLFDTDHEALTQSIITSQNTEINSILSRVSPDFPSQVASVIDHSHPNQQVIQLISSQIDVDRMDYLLRDSYYTGTNYGNFELSHILRVMQPKANGICFSYQGMHAVEDYLLSRYQMYMQVYFHPASRSMEVILQNLLKRAKYLYPQQKNFFASNSPALIPFFEEKVNLTDYLKLDDGVLNTYFQSWIFSDDDILSDLADAFINRRLFKSFTYQEGQEGLIQELSKDIEAIGYDTNYYTGCHSNFNLPYDRYRPETSHPQTQIDILQKDGSLAELSSLSPLIQSLSGGNYGDHRFYFPKDMLLEDDLFQEAKGNFKSHIRNDQLI